VSQINLTLLRRARERGSVPPAATYTNPLSR
jgi:hypothetical protein